MLISTKRSIHTFHLPCSFCSRLLILVLGIFCITASYSQNVWQGNFSSDWNDPGNWSLGTVPTSNDIVTLNGSGFPPILDGNTIARVKSITVNTPFIIEKNSLLDIYGPVTGNPGLFQAMRTSALVTNKGSIHIGQHGVIAVPALRVLSDFVNDGGTIRIDSISVAVSYGAVVKRLSNSTFTNQNGGQILIGNSGYVIPSYGINIEPSPSQVFINDNATIMIDNVTGPAFRNTGSFINRNGGKMLLGTTGGQIGSGFSNVRADNGFVNDNASLLVGNTAGSGFSIGNNGKFENKNGGLIKVKNSQGVAFLFTSTTPGSNGVCSVMEFNSTYQDQVASTFTNQGLFILTGLQSSTINGTFNNNGVISDLYASLPSFTNNEILLETTTTSSCTSFSPALSIGSIQDFSITGIFTNPDATQSAGSYTAATNTFVPTLTYYDSVRLYVKFNDPSGGCNLIAPWDILFTTACCASPTTCYLDNDGDTFGDADFPQQICGPFLLC